MVPHTASTSARKWCMAAFSMGACLLVVDADSTTVVTTTAATKQPTLIGSGSSPLPTSSPIGDALNGTIVAVTQKHIHCGGDQDFDLVSSPADHGGSVDATTAAASAGSSSSSPSAATTTSGNSYCIKVIRKEPFLRCPPSRGLKFNELTGACERRYNAIERCSTPAGSWLDPSRSVCVKKIEDHAVLTCQGRSFPDTDSPTGCSAIVPVALQSRCPTGLILSSSKTSTGSAVCQGQVLTDPEPFCDMGGELVTSSNRCLLSQRFDCSLPNNRILLAEDQCAKLCAIRGSTTCPLECSFHNNNNSAAKKAASMGQTPTFTIRRETTCTKIAEYPAKMVCPENRGTLTGFGKCALAVAAEPEKICPFGTDPCTEKTSVPAQISCRSGSKLECTNNNQGGGCKCFIEETYPLNKDCPEPNSYLQDDSICVLHVPPIVECPLKTSFVENPDSPNGQYCQGEIRKPAVATWTVVFEKALPVDGLSP